LCPAFTKAIATADLFILNPMIETGSSQRIDVLSSNSAAELVLAAQTLLREYGDFILASTGPARFCAARLDGEVLNPAEAYSSSGGELLLAYVCNAAAGCAGYRLLTADVPERACELKRMWVRPEFRGADVGRRLAEAVFERASAAGYEAIYLDTEPEAMPAAVRLYQRLGFEECPPYTKDVVGGLRFFRRSLSHPQGGLVGSSLNKRLSP
jgi:putative acetyltransferase